jgi:tetratricopeptide (TPR) repeat protein
LEKSSPVRGQKVAIVGGGVAGLTSAAAGIACGADVWVFEAEHELCAIQRETDSRYIHPSINFWPEEPLQPITNWPFLNWHAASCREVIAEIERQWNGYFSLAADVQMGTRVSRIVPSNERVQLKLGRGSTESFDVVVSTVGFGREHGPPGLQVESYWSDNSIDRKPVTKSKKIWISGAGDGGLIDCLRVCYSGFDLGRLLVKVASELESLSDQIAETEATARKIADLDTRSEFLADAYAEFAGRPRVNTPLSRALAKGSVLPFVCLVHRLKKPFDQRTAPIHRLLFAAALKNKRVEAYRGDLKSDPEGPILHRPDGTSEKITPLKLIVRHGAGGALEAIISPKAVKALRGEEHKKNQDALKGMRWQPGFFENLPTAQFPTSLRKKGQFYADAVRIAQGAVRQQGLTANVSVGGQPPNPPELRITIFETEATHTRSIPEKVFGIITRQEVESEISRFHGLRFGRSNREPPVIHPGSLVSFGVNKQRQVITCLTTRSRRTDVLGLCVTHFEAPEIGSSVTMTDRSALVGEVVEVKQFDGRLAESEDADVVCVFFSIAPSTLLQSAPVGHSLAGLHRDPFELLDNTEGQRVTRWGPSGTFATGTVLAVSGEGIVQTKKGTRRLSGLIFVQGVNTQPFSRPGDSGALVVSMESKAIGVVFAGTSKITYLLPLAVLLDRCGAQLLTSEAAAPAPDPETLLELGRLRIDQGSFLEAESVLEQAARGFERLFGRQHPKTATPLHGLAVARLRLGRPAEAETMLREVVQIRQHTLGPDDPAIAGTLQSLGWALYDQGRFAEAEQEFRQLLAIRERGANASETATALRGLGAVLRRAARYQHAEDLLRQALQMRETALGLDDLLVSDDLLELGWLQMEMDNFEQAKLSFDRCLEIRLRKLGPGHLETTAALQGLASLSLRLGRPADAERLLGQVLEARERAFGPDHPGVAATLQALGWAYIDQGNVDEAESVFRRALRIREKGSSSVDLAQALRALGSVLRRKRQLSDSKTHLDRSLSLRKTALGRENVQVSDDLLELGWLNHDMGDFQGARRLFERCLQIRERALGPEHSLTATALHALASAVGRLGHTADAEKFFRRALAIREHALDPAHPAVAATLQSLGWICGDQGRLEEAETLFGGRWKYGRKVPIGWISLMRCAV